MAREMSQSEFEKLTIASDDDRDYSESGYVALVEGGWAGLASFSHCSCYGTFTALCGGGVGDYMERGTPQFAWEGTPEQLVDMAHRKADPNMPEREADPKDCDYDHLLSVYEQVTNWAQARATA